MACSAAGNLDLAIPNWVEPVRNNRVGAKSKGHKIHELIADLITFQYETTKLDEEGNEVTSRVYKNGPKDLLYTAEILTYVSEIWSTRRFKVLSEEPMKAHWLDQPTDTTADLVLYTQDEMHIFDWKVGKIQVDAIDNEQLLFYAATYGILASKAKQITVHICQPWAGGMEEWVITTERLKQFIDDAVEAQRKVLRGDTTFGPSDHCTFCPANPHSRGDKGGPFCPAMMQVLYPTTGTDEEAILNL